VSSPLNIGIIGLGKMGLTRYREFVAHPGAVVTHGADPDATRFEQFPDVACDTDPQTVIDSDVQAVLIATPNRLTPELVVKALDAGKHVLCEKPPGCSVEDIETIREAEARNPACKLMFGFNHRYHAGIQEAKRILDSGSLGTILWMRGIYGKGGGEGFEESWRSNPEMSGHGILLDQGIHMLDLFRWFGGDFPEVKSMVSNSHWDIDMEDNAFAILRNDAGTIAMLHSSSTQWKHKFSLEINCSDGYLTVNGILSSTRSYGDETITVARRKFDDGFTRGKPHEETIYFDNDPSWELEVADFIRCITDDTAVPSGTSTDALKAMELVFAIYGDDA
jgi:predicted dehydrogenase